MKRWVALLSVVMMAACRPGPTEYDVSTAPDISGYWVGVPDVPDDGAVIFPTTYHVWLSQDADHVWGTAALDGYGLRWFEVEGTVNRRRVSLTFFPLGSGEETTLTGSIVGEGQLYLRRSERFVAWLFVQVPEE